MAERRNTGQSMAEPAAVGRFLEALARSGLLPPGAVRAAIAIAPDDARADAKKLADPVARPNLSQTYDVGVDQGVNYIAMEYIAGMSLYRLVATGGPLPVGRAAKLFAQAAAGLDAAHAAGVVHRDLKPSNLMVTPRDQV